LSYPGDTDCSNPTCGTGNGNFSGDLPTFLYPLATAQGTTEVEIYWRDLSLAYDPTNYCSISLGACNLSSSISVDNQLTVTEQYNWFSDNGTPPNAVGIGTGCGGTQGQGLCTYESNINSAHGQH
jgi:hypothetical protein